MFTFIEALNQLVLIRTVFRNVCVVDIGLCVFTVKTKQGLACVSAVIAEKQNVSFTYTSQFITFRSIKPIIFNISHYTALVKNDRI